MLRSNFNRDYFTKIDIRVDKEIRLYSRSAKILTAHPASSYELQQDANRQYILRITNPQLKRPQKLKMGTKTCLFFIKICIIIYKVLPLHVGYGARKCTYVAYKGEYTLLYIRARIE